MQRTLLAIGAALTSPLLAQSASFTTLEVAPSVIQFTDTSSGGTPISWAWDFENDGVVDDVTQNPTWFYQSPGAYECSLTVDFGASIDTAVQNVFISTIPVPGFGTTFSSSALTRGFWFQAPTRFSIIGVQVPDETGHGRQNVAIYRLAGAPPAYSGSASGGLEFLSTLAPSGTSIPCVVSFDTGEFVGLLGACGDSSIMNNSYASATGPQPSTILGQSTTITRFLTQTNLVNSSGTGAYSSELGGALARVFATITPCVGIPYGDGTPSSQAQAPRLTTTELPFVGQTAKLTLENFDNNVLGVIAVGTGRVNVPTPLGTLLINNLAGSATLNGGAVMSPGSYDFQFSVPQNPALVGFGPVNWQAACLVTGTGEIALSNGNEWWLDNQ